MCNDTYKTIASPSKGLFKDKGSKFHAFAYPVKNEEEIKSILNKLRKEYHDARHHCYAYMLGFERNIYRANDDGEPSSTAGKPILGQINSLTLTNVLIVVVRYFGGVLLGTSGLINAYKNAAADALNNATIIEKTVNYVFEISFNYPVMNNVMKTIKDENVEILSQDLNLDCRIKLSVRKKNSQKILEKLKIINGIKIHEIGYM